MLSQLKVIYGRKVFLRPIELDDAAHIVRWRNDPEIKKWMFNQDQVTLESHLNWFGSQRQNRIDFVICDIENEKPIGTLNFINIKDKKAEAGKMLGDKEYWGKGYAKEAFTLWIDFGFLDLDFDLITVKTMADNTGNIKLNEKLGFKEVNRSFREISFGNVVEFIQMEKTK
jgi:RimJ/RimL family protein N-acetyltransferase